MESIASGAIVGGIVGFLGVLLIGLVIPRKKCPECGKPLPKFRKPKKLKQAVAGGWTCENCGCQIDRSGNKIIDKGK